MRRFAFAAFFVVVLVGLLSGIALARGNRTPVTLTAYPAGGYVLYVIQSNGHPPVADLVQSCADGSVVDVPVDWGGTTHAVVNIHLPTPPAGTSCTGSVVGDGVVYASTTFLTH